MERPATHSCPSPLVASLDKEVLFYRRNTFAKSTVKTYTEQQLASLDFCNKVDIHPVRLSHADLGRYIAFLSRRLAFSSIRQYLNAVRLLHLDAGFPNPLEGNWYVSSVLKGVRRVKGDTCNAKLPISIDILRGIFLRLNILSSFDRTFWAACVVGFFSFFRKSNLLIQSVNTFDPSRHLCASDVQFTPGGAVLLVRWSKVIQFRERVLRIPLPRISDSPLCPSMALLRMMLDLPHGSNSVPIFRFWENTHSPLTQAQFTVKLHSCLKAMGVDPRKYSGHSFRRGGRYLRAAVWSSCRSYKDPR